MCKMTPKIPDNIQKKIAEKGGMEKIISSLPSREHLDRMASIHSALGDPLRLKIICFLRLQESCVCLLREIVNISYSKLSYHLSVLKNAGLIRGEKQANYIIYSLTPLGERYAGEICLKSGETKNGR